MTRTRRHSQPSGGSQDFGDFGLDGFVPGNLHKDDFLLTPIRKKLFPKASPGVLRKLLSTPSLRLDFSADLTNNSSSGFSLHPAERVATSTPWPASSGHRSRVSDDSDRIGLAGPVAALPAHNPLPSPPPTTELPYAEFRPPPGTEPGSGLCALSEQPSGSVRPSRRRSPYGDRGRSSQGGSHERTRQSPLPDALSLSPALRAAPCSPLVTRTGAVLGDELEGIPSLQPRPPPYLPPRPGLCRASDPRLLMHNNLAFGVVRNFQRVLDQLQGLGCARSDSDQPSSSPSHPVHEAQGCTESLALPDGCSDDASVNTNVMPVLLSHAGWRESTLCDSERRAQPSADPPAPHPHSQSQPETCAAAELAGQNFTTTASTQLLPSLGPELENTLEPGTDRAAGHAHARTGPKPRTPHDDELDSDGCFSFWERRLRLELGEPERGSPRSAARGSRSQPARERGPGGGTPWAGAGASPLRPAHASSSLSDSSSPFHGLQEEFVTLLSDQALEEEAHALHLREIAGRLEEMARCRRHLAEVTAMKRF